MLCEIGLGEISKQHLGLNYLGPPKSHGSRDRTPPRYFKVVGFLELKKPICCRLAGTDVMITIFCDFPQFSAKKLAFFLNTNVMIKLFSKFSFVLSQKRQFFR
jgi:hypothetical protein